MSICQSCGACCASFRVDFHPAELARGAFAWGPGVPLPMTVPVTPATVRMRGSDAFEPRCVALAGEVGKAVVCSIYDGRPSPCREFDTSDDACARARRNHGLPALTTALVPVSVGQLCGEAGDNRRFPSQTGAATVDARDMGESTSQSPPGVATTRVNRAN